MKILDFLILVVLFSLLIGGIYLLYMNLPGSPEKFEEYKFKGEPEKNSTSVQFYPNMRYKDRIISFAISNSCDTKTKANAMTAFSVISDKTVLDFYEPEIFSDAEIKILCSSIAPEPEEEGHFVAGEGGPSEVINNTYFAVILSGRVSLFRANECSEPVVAIHEILHAFGFDHNNNPESIMYPLTKCSQKIDDYILQEINRLYKIDSLSDLIIEKVTAEKSGLYLNFEVVIGNFGLKDSKSADLFVEVDGESIKSFNIEPIEIGTRRILTVENLRVPRSTEMIYFEIESNEPELDKKNNRIGVELIPLQ